MRAWFLRRLPALIAGVTLAVVCAPAALADTIEIKSGNAAVGSVDPNITIESTDNTDLPGGCAANNVTPRSARVVWHSPYTIIPGTNYVGFGTGCNIAPWGWAPHAAGSGLTVFKTTFTLPAGATNVTLRLSVRADNRFSFSLNGGTPVGSTRCDTFYWGSFPTPPTFTVTSGFVPGVNTLRFTVDNCGHPGSLALDFLGSVTYTPNTPPTATLVAPDTVSEGETVTLKLEDAVDVPADSGSLRYAFSCEGPVTADYASAGASPSGTCVAGDGPGTLDVYALVIDEHNGYTNYERSVTITNVAPAVGPVTGPADPQAVGTAVTLSTSFTDPGTADTHTATWNWGDDQTTSGPASDGAAVASHTYTEAGVYTVTVTIADNRGDSDSSTFQYVVIYSGTGFVTGGGWINSAAGSLTWAPSASGKATFGFVSKYLPGRTTPDGRTEFQFKAGNFNFHSKTYTWLVVSGWKAQYRGTGTINGSGTYDFVLTAYDGHRPGGNGVDRFRIKIWDASTNSVVYDNRSDATSDHFESADPQSLGGGSIVIHRD